MKIIVNQFQGDSTMKYIVQFIESDSTTATLTRKVCDTLEEAVAIFKEKCALGLRAQIENLV